jgi:hypothetical protein
MLFKAKNKSVLDASFSFSKQTTVDEFKQEKGGLIFFSLLFMVFS